MSDGEAFRRFEWRKSYDHVHQLPALGCAWEFVRRNPKFVDSWSTLKSAWMEVDGAHDIKIVHAGHALGLPTPYIWAASPDADARHASVVWDHRATTRVLKAVALQPRMSFGGQVLDLDQIAVEKTLVLAADGAQNLLLRDGFRSLQIAIVGAPITAPFCLFVDTAVPEVRPDIQLALLGCWRAIRAGIAWPDECFPPHAYAKRAARVLLALDGHLAGVSHREIATALVGEARVDRDWSDPGEHLRDTVRRAVARGLALMEGGYRMFLR